MMSTEKLVKSAFRLLLGRRLENPAIASLYEGRSGDDIKSLIRQSEEFQNRLRSSPFVHFASNFDVLATIFSFVDLNIKADEDYVTNFLGVKVDPVISPAHLQDKYGLIEQVPIPANWHADMAEWGAVLRAVDLSGDAFTIVELGCGWGCWLNNGGAAARLRGKKVKLIGVEGDLDHVAFAHHTCRINGFLETDVRVEHGIAGSSSGFALFPKHMAIGENWGLQPLFNLDAETRRERVGSGLYEELRIQPLESLVDEGKIIDLLHVDIQGGEADLVEGSMDFLNERVAYMFIGTHSREAESKIWSLLLNGGWCLEIERPAIFSLHDDGPVLRIDGSYGWRNLALRPFPNSSNS